MVLTHHDRTSYVFVSRLELMRVQEMVTLHAPVSGKSVTPRSDLFLSSLAIFAQVGSFWELATKESMGSKVQVFTEQCSQKDLELSELR